MEITLVRPLLYNLRWLISNTTHKLLLLFLLVFLAPSLQANSATESIARQKMMSGDIVFRAGIGYLSDIVRAAEQSSSEKRSKIAPFSHVGILVKKNNEWFVIHSEPSDEDPKLDRVKIEPLDVFLNPKYTREAAVYRIRTTDEIKKKAVQFAYEAIGAKFSFESTDNLPPEPLIFSKQSHYYCTELVLAAYNQDKVVLPAKTTHITLPLLGGHFFLPNDLLRTQQFDYITHVSTQKNAPPK